jgi:hypothetical protein
MGQLAPYSTAIGKLTASASWPIPQLVQRIQDHYQKSRKQYQLILEREDMEMIDSVQARVAHLDQEVQDLIKCCNNETEAIEVEFDDVPHDSIIIA